MKKIFNEIKNLWNTLTTEYKVLAVLIITAIVLLWSGVTDLVSGYNPSWLVEVLRPNHISSLIAYGWVKIGIAVVICIIPFANYLYWSWRCRKAEKNIQELTKEANRRDAEEAVILQ